MLQWVKTMTAADQIDLSVMVLKYAMGAITVGYQTNESDSGTGVR